MQQPARIVRAQPPCQRAVGGPPIGLRGGGDHGAAYEGVPEDQAPGGVQTGQPAGLDGAEDPFGAVQAGHRPGEGAGAGAVQRGAQQHPRRLRGQGTEPLGEERFQPFSQRQPLRQRHDAPAVLVLQTARQFAQKL
ncbi:hypothetical protein AABB02_39855 [Streptomyces rimosus]|uniref:hypothetical protein n=1 Tax=Streptomyces rimosus TaxID=1927 RepID=UPI0031DCA1FF